MKSSIHNITLLKDPCNRTIFFQFQVDVAMELFKLNFRGRLLSRLTLGRIFLIALSGETVLIIIIIIIVIKMIKLLS